MPATSPDGDRQSPAPQVGEGQHADAGTSIRTAILPPHRQLMAALLAASALVPLSQPAEAQEKPVPEYGNVALKAFVRQPSPESPAPAPVSDATELHQIDLAVKAEEERQERIERKKAERRAAKAKAEAKREAEREAAERARKRAAARRAAAKPDFVRPASGRLTSGFGARWGTTHTGIDIANDIGTPIVAVADGTVIEAGPASGFGLWVKVRHDDGTVTVYGHMNRITAWTGQRVRAGQRIATIGNRGYSTGPHLHFEVWVGGSTKVDPRGWLAARGVSV
ncbi:M23 family metallopeptidase [Haloechinothrix salitolerans]|uniref:M23 family metallopeptidase n=1 Tax=Haloechinothrix salitolerans TaxID=926830 RepID=A0ABW2C4F5_9PSEU